MPSSTISSSKMQASAGEGGHEAHCHHHDRTMGESSEVEAATTASTQAILAEDEGQYLALCQCEAECRFEKFTFTMVNTEIFCRLLVK